ncbi:hypothetical protein P3T35_003232 [Kitasatospora sp. GP30]|nr:hypothetical protein [Kitasatospora sp. GP30]
MRLGITGHRGLTPDIERQVRQLLDEALRNEDPAELTGVSCTWGSLSRPQPCIQVRHQCCDADCSGGRPLGSAQGPVMNRQATVQVSLPVSRAPRSPGPFWATAASNWSAIRVS